MRTDSAKRFLRLHYKAPDYQFGQVELDVELIPQRTLVHSRIEVIPTEATQNAKDEVPLILDGEDLEFSLKIIADDKPVLCISEGNFKHILLPIVATENEEDEYEF